MSLFGYSAAVEGGNLNTESLSIGDIPGVRGTSSPQWSVSPEYADSGEWPSSGLVLGEDSGVSSTELPPKAPEKGTVLSEDGLVPDIGSACDLRHALFGCFLLLGRYL